MPVNWEFYAPYFTMEEFLCPCCGEEHMEPHFMTLLITARRYADVPFPIESGWRCAKHNREVGGVDDSAHTYGFAADIRCNDNAKRFTIVDALRRVGIQRIGIGKTLVHCDSDKSKPQKVIWLY